MTMARIHTLFATVLASGLVLAGACKKDEKKAEPAASDKTATDPKVAEKPTAEKAAPAVAPIGAGADDLALLPVDSEAVMGINFSQLQASPLWKKFVEPQMMKGEFPQKLGQFKAKCGFDPMTAIKSLSIGMKGVGGDNPDGVIVVHGAGKKESLDCFDKMKDEAAKSGDEISRDGDVVLVKSKKGETVAITFVNDTTAVAVVGPNASKDGVKKAAQGGSALKSSPAFVEMYGKINTQASLWMLVNGNAKVFDKAASMGVKPKAVFGSVNVTDGLSVDVRMRLESADQATQRANAFNGQLAGFKSMVDKLEVGNDGSDVKVSVAMSQQKLEALVKNLGAMFGGRGGGGMGGGMGGGTP
jgi:hypothetical protein